MPAPSLPPAGVAAPLRCDVARESRPRWVTATQPSRRVREHDSVRARTLCVGRSGELVVWSPEPSVHAPERYANEALLRRDRSVAGADDAVRGRRPSLIRDREIITRMEGSACMPAPTEERCAYVHPVGNLRGETPPTADGGEWHCPHYRFVPADGPEGGHDRCPFHLASGDRDGPDVAPSAAVYFLVALGESGDTLSLSPRLRSYVDRVSRDGGLSGSERTRAIGATFAGVDAEYAVLDGPSNSPLDLRASTFVDEVSLRDTTVGQALWLDGADFYAPVTATETTFSRRVRCDGAQFNAGLSTNQADFRSWAEFSDVVVDGEANFRGTTFEDGIFATDVCFAGPADFMNADFFDVANFTRGRFERGALFSSANFEGSGMFRETAFVGPVGLCDALVEGTDVNERWRTLSVEDGTVAGTAVVFRNATCGGDLRFEGARFDGDVAVVGSRLVGNAVFEDVRAADEPVCFDFTETSVVGGSFGTTRPARFDFTDAVVGDIEDIHPSPALIQFERSEFEGFDFGKHRDLFEGMQWDLCRDASMSPAQRENVFLRAKNGATQMGENTAAARFHYREADQRGRSYRTRILEAVQSGELRRAVPLVRRWVGNRFLKYSCGYGEKPGRVFLSSIAIVLLYAVVYALLDVQATYSGVLAPLVLSLDSFGAIVLGLPSVDSIAIGLVVASEAFLGPFFVALFVFDLTQSINR